MMEKIKYIENKLKEDKVLEESDKCIIFLNDCVLVEKYIRDKYTYTVYNYNTYEKKYLCYRKNKLQKDDYIKFKNKIREQVFYNTTKSVDESEIVEKESNSLKFTITEAIKKNNYNILLVVNTQEEQKKSEEIVKRILYEFNIDIDNFKYIVVENTLNYVCDVRLNAYLSNINYKNDFVDIKKTIKENKDKVNVLPNRCFYCNNQKCEYRRMQKKLKNSYYNIVITSRSNFLRNIFNVETNLKKYDKVLAYDSNIVNKILELQPTNSIEEIKLKRILEKIKPKRKSTKYNRSLTKLCNDAISSTENLFLNIRTNEYKIVSNILKKQLIMKLEHIDCFFNSKNKNILKLELNKKIKKLEEFEIENIKEITVRNENAKLKYIVGSSSCYVDKNILKNKILIVSK